MSRYQHLLAISILLVICIFQFSTGKDTVLFLEVEKEAESREIEQLKLREYSCNILLFAYSHEPIITDRLHLSAAHIIIVNQFGNKNHSSISSHKLFNHSPPQFV